MTHDPGSLQSLFGPRMPLPVGYVAYIDEAGDQGLQRVKPIDPEGASEWMVMSAFVLKVENDGKVLDWLKAIVKNLDQHQITHLHFHRLRDDKKDLVCRELAALPVRFFTVMSHKRNMKGYRNHHAELAKVNRTAWFFCWLSRLLLERVTDYCHKRSKLDYGEPRSVRIEFSDSGGVKMDDIRAYYKYLSEQSRMGTLYHDRYDLAWPVVDLDQMFTRPNKLRAGLQLADSVTSAFFRAVERNPAGAVEPRFAKLLLPKVCPRPGIRRSRYGYGLKVMPTWIPSRLPDDQHEIIRSYVNT